MSETTLKALKSLNEEVQNADSIAETPLSKLFHVVRTTGGHYYSTAKAGVRVDDDGSVDVEMIGCLQEGHWFPPEKLDSYDAVIAVGIQPFMSTEEFKNYAGESLSRNISQLRTPA